MKIKLNIFGYLLVFALFSGNVFSQVINDPLQGSTVGTKYGGSFNSEGYQPGIGNNHILYDINPNTIVNGYIEFEVKGFNPASLPVDEDHAFAILYDGRGISEPVAYFNDFKYNYFRWNFHWRQNKNAFKCVVTCAAPTTERINSTYAVYPGGGDLRDWFSEPTGTGITWNTSTWYKMKIEWNNKTFTASVNGTVVWTTSGPYDYVPQDLRIWLGSGPDKYNADVNVTYRNFKLVDLGGGSTNYLNISPTSKSVSSSAGSASFNVTSNVSWNISDNATWITLAPSSGSNNASVTATYQQNTSTSSRTATLTLTGGGFTRTATVTQSGSTATDYLTVSKDTLETISLVDTLSFQITSNISWTISESLDWISVTPVSGTNNATVLVDFLENQSFSKRSGFITVSGGGITKNIFVVQNGIYPYINVDPDTHNVDYSGGQVVSEITSNVNWVVDKNVDWVTLSTSDSSGNVSLLITCSKNNNKEARETSIAVHNDSISKSITIKQGSSNFYLSAFPSSWNVSRNSGSVNFSVESNVNWSIINQSDWIKTSIIDSSGNAVVSAQYTRNTDTTSRVADLVISNDELSDTVKIIQAAAPPVTIDVQINPANSGTVNGAGTFGQGSSIKLEAISSEGWKFDNWTENSTILSVDTLYSLVLNASKVIVANFSINTAIRESNIIPTEFVLSQNYPNPFNPSTNIQFGLPKRSNVIIKIHNVLGKEVSLLLNETLEEGLYRISFNASNLPSGMYFYTIDADNFKATKKMLLIK